MSCTIISLEIYRRVIISVNIHSQKHSTFIHFVSSHKFFFLDLDTLFSFVIDDFFPFKFRFCALRNGFKFFNNILSRTDGPMVLIIFENSRQISFFVTFCKDSRNNMTIPSIITEHRKIWWWCNHFILHPFDSWTTVIRSIREVEKRSQFIGREITSLREKSYQKEAKSDISKRNIQPTKDIMLRVRYH